MLDPFAQQWRQLPGCLIEPQDAATTRITHSAVDGDIEIVMFTHHGAFSATRYEEGMLLDTNQRLHAWINVRNAASELVHHEITCSPERLAAFLDEWHMPPEPAPATTTLKTIADNPDKLLTEGIFDAIEYRVELNLLEKLPDAPQVLEQLKQDLARLDGTRLASFWPRDARGRLAPRTTIILAAYGPATRKRPALTHSKLKPAV
ncbi:hypothetical protein [Comamonas sp. Y33R10-2]|uniref:hypothetical protein n=1 Tax=Comamonas sp. Y33R10-2 TaxID=2853257 RepID=UPI002104C61B|nr:hypothetical protein [Comamonas sp. Y33R10-2]